MRFGHTVRNPKDEVFSVIRWNWCPLVVYLLCMFSSSLFYWSASSVVFSFFSLRAHAHTHTISLSLYVLQLSNIILHPTSLLLNCLFSKLSDITYFLQYVLQMSVLDIQAIISTGRPEKNIHFNRDCLRTFSNLNINVI